MCLQYLRMADKIFQEIITRNSPNFMKIIILKIQEIQQTLKTTTTTTKHIKITSVKTSDNERS